MAKYKITLLEKKEIAKETMAFKFKKPEGFEFHAGNNCDWTLINPPETDKEGNTRAFSIIAAPYEDYVGFATRMRDTAFKRTLKNLEIGYEMELEGPFGSFELDKDTTKPAVCLSGGIGITPFISMVKQSTHDNSGHKIFLFFANHSQEDAAFFQELQALETQNKNFKFIPIMTQMEGWSGEKDHINRDMIAKYVSDVFMPVYYFAGPTQMVRTLRQLVADFGISEDNMRWEEFPGY